MEEDWRDQKEGLWNIHFKEEKWRPITSSKLYFCSLFTFCRNMKPCKKERNTPKIKQQTLKQYDKNKLMPKSLSWMQFTTKNIIW